jgi:hypothetical protein
VTFIAVAKFSGARLRRVTPPEFSFAPSTFDPDWIVEGGAGCGIRVSDSNEEKTYGEDIYHVPVTIAGRDARRPLEKVTDGRSNLMYFPATDGPNVRIDGPARWTQRPEQRFTVSLIPPLQHAAECQPI